MAWNSSGLYRPGQLAIHRRELAQPADVILKIPLFIDGQAGRMRPSVLHVEILKDLFPGAQDLFIFRANIINVVEERPLVGVHRSQYRVPDRDRPPCGVRGLASRQFPVLVGLKISLDR